MGSENWAFKGFWVCFFPEPAGNEMALLDFVLFLFIFPHSCYDSVILSCFQEAQSAINDLNGMQNSIALQLPFLLLNFLVKLCTALT